tara:strand:- start:6 stop:458 length:453 start_codon:yes stop_codon:yes gene_type:complete
MALTKIGSGGIENVTNAANATFLTIDASEQITVASEGGAVTTSLQQGLAKWWVNADNSGTHEVQGSFNNSSIVDDTSSKTSFSYTSNMNDTVYSVPCGGHYDDTGRTQMYFSCFNNLATSGVKCNTGTRDTGNTATEIDLIYATVFGSLA